jgi:hypothetical protein
MTRQSGTGKYERLVARRKDLLPVSSRAPVRGDGALRHRGGGREGTHQALVCPTQKIEQTAKKLGVELDRDANAHRGPRISTAARWVSAFLIPTNEELMIARHTGARLGFTSGQP